MLAVFMLTLVIGNQFIPSEKAVERDMLGHDFTAFYSAGHFAATGQFRKLYDIQAVKEFEQETGRRAGLSLGDSYGPYWNPPFYAWIIAPLSKLTYANALFIWTIFNIACGLGAIALLCRMLAPPGLSLHDAKITWKSYGLIPLLLICSMPVMQALSHGQNTMTSLLLLTATVTFWRSSRPLLTGLACGLLFYKPQLGAIVAVAVVLTLGWRSLAGLAITGFVLLLITITTMPGALTDFLHQLPANVRFMQIDHPYVWERHATIKAFWRLMFQGRGAGEPILAVTILTLGICGLLGVGLLGCALRNPPANRDRVIAATIATMPLLMPFYFDYDLMLLAVPAVLFANEFVPGWQASSNQKHGRDAHATEMRLDRCLIRAWIALYLWMLINPGLASQTHVNLTVPLLTAVATMLMRRAMRGNRFVRAGDIHTEQIPWAFGSRIFARSQ